MDTFLFTSESVNEGHPTSCATRSPMPSRCLLDQHGHGLRRDHHQGQRRLREDRARHLPRDRLRLRRRGSRCRPLQGACEHRAAEPDIAQGVHGHFTKRPEDIGAGDQEDHLSPEPSGRFVIGGPHGDAGLTGRKIIIDTYGGWGAHGGGAFSGKDPTKVDRSGAYVVRQAAKSVVASGLARRCIVQVSYAIGVPEPLSVFVDSYGTGKISDKEILQIVKENFDFRPGMITINLDLKRGGNRYLKTAAYGHFGRDEPDFTWEVVKPLKWEKPAA
ncbi:unnamed protein product [Spirodela intermedia]|uniref:methionine adenosyltransferase n=1 Tax=Spirodela intermedia TaxID=51605 RepID=A0A7I8JFF8_SPIIN|nr:unnamed protein product [Spirodela intermedia]CAA6668918.1 unnamed protein product [Spirodela intermedia]